MCHSGSRCQWTHPRSRVATANLGPGRHALRSRARRRETQPEREISVRARQLWQTVHLCRKLLNFGDNADNAETVALAACE